MKKRILLPVEAQLDVALVMGVNERTVRRALAYDSNTDISRRIRKMALNKGGEVVGSDNLVTTFPVGMMVQTYGGRLRIETDLIEGKTVVYLDGEDPAVFSDLNIAEYTRLQQRYIRKVNVQ